MFVFATVTYSKLCKITTLFILIFYGFIKFKYAYPHSAKTFTNYYYNLKVACYLKLGPD